MTDERDQGKFNLRLPPGMRERISDIAKANGRSMNAEIVRTLEEAYPPEPVLDEVIDYARTLTEMYLDDASHRTLRDLREVLAELVNYARERRGDGK